MNKKLALISICIPAYNVAKYIHQTISCLLLQTYEHIEIVIVDDGSNDDTGAIISSIKDERIKKFTIPNSGASAARNYAFDKASGEIIIFFDADDYVLPHFISTQYDLLKKDLNAVVLSDWGRFYDDDISTFRIEKSQAKIFNFYEWITNYWYSTNGMTNPGRALMSRSLIEKAGLWNNELNLNDDFEFFTRVFKNSSKIIFNHSAALFYRSGLVGLSAKRDFGGYTSYHSSILMGITIALKTYPGDLKVKKSCANLLQLFVYSAYPSCPELIQQSEKFIITLGGSDLTYPSGRITNFISKILGWKNAKRIRSAI